MARDKYIDTQPRLLAVDLSRQLLPGTFEHALNHLLDHAIDLSHVDARFPNDTTGAPAYPPALLLRVVLFAYSQGIVSSRQIERASPRARHVHRTVRRPRAALHDDRQVRQLVGRGHRLRLCGGAGGVRHTGLNRPGDVRHRRRETAE